MLSEEIAQLLLFFYYNSTAMCSFSLHFFQFYIIADLHENVCHNLVCILTW